MMIIEITMLIYNSQQVGFDDTEDDDDNSDDVDYLS